MNDEDHRKENAPPTPELAVRAGRLAPLRGKAKEHFVEELFDRIANRYDLMNLVMTAGLLRYWQRVFAAHTGLQRGNTALDVCCGTGELASIMARQVGPEGWVEGIDLSEKMLQVGRRKLSRRPEGRWIRLQKGNALQLPYEDKRFDCVSTGFAMRNVSDVRQAITEMARVLRPGGRVLCLELSHPVNPLIKGPYQLYFRHLVPLMGRWANNRADEKVMSPYTWLPESLRYFPDQEGLAGIFRQAGLEHVRYHNLTGGIVCLHVGEKPETE